MGKVFFLSGQIKYSSTNLKNSTSFLEVNYCNLKFEAVKLIDGCISTSKQDSRFPVLQNVVWYVVSRLELSGKIAKQTKK